MTSSEQEKHLFFQIQLFQLKAIFMLNVSVKFELDHTEDEEAAPILIYNCRLFSAICDTQQSEDEVIDVIVTSLWIWLLLPLRDFVSQAWW